MDSQKPITDAGKALLDRLDSVALTDLNQRLQRFSADLGDHLFDLSMSRSYSDSGHNAHYAALNSLKKERDRFANGLQAAIAEVEREQRAELARRGAAVDADVSDLNLVATEELEERLALDRITRRANEDYLVELESLLLRIASIRGQDPDAVIVPYSPEQLCRAFSRLLRLLDLDDRVSLDVLEFFDQRIIRKLDKFYRNLNALLESAGVLPGMEQRIREHGSPRAAGGRPKIEKSREPEPKSPAPRNPQRPGEETHAHSEIRDLVERMVSGVMRQITPGQDQEGVVAAARAALGLNPARASTPSSGEENRQLASLLGQLQQRSAAQGPAANSAKALLSSHPEDLSRIVPDGKLPAESAVQLELVDNVFTTLQGNMDVARSVMPALEALHIPLARLALLEPDLFSDRSHAAHQVVDRLANLSSSANFPNRTLERELSSITSEVVENFDGDDAVFDKALEKLKAIDSRQSQSLERNVERVLSALQGQEKVESAKRRISLMLRECAVGETIPLAVRALMDAGWNELLLQILLRDGENSVAWSDQQRRLQQLIEGLERLQDETLDASQRSELRLRLSRALSDIESDLGDALPGHVGHQPAIKELMQVVTGDAPLRELSVLELPQAGTQLPQPEQLDDKPRLKRWLKRVQELEPGARLSYRDREGKRRSMRLVWISQDRDRYVFVNEKGQKLAELTAVQLARQLSRGVRPPGRVEQMSVLDQTLYSTIEQAQKQLTFERNHDSVTRLFNRRTLLQQVDRAIQNARSQEVAHTLLCVDIDRFDLVANLFDEVSANQVLTEFAALLAQLNDRHTVTARLEEDAFGVLLLQRDLSAGRELAEKIRGDIEQATLEIDGEQVSFTVSIGVVEINAGVTDEAVALERAMRAVAQAKAGGRNQVACFDQDEQEMFEYRAARAESEQELRTAMSTDRFVLRAQPIVKSALAEEAPSSQHYEILLAVRDDDGALQSPQSFIDSAEEYGFIHVVDRWVVTETFRWMSELMDRQKQLPQLSINLSATCVTDDSFLDFLLEQISEHGIGTSKLCFEITETGTINNLVKAADFVRTLRNIGCAFALDDFGTGAAGHRYLRELPVDYVKIDGTFIARLCDSETDYAMAKSINDLAHFLGQQTIAECVESPDVLAPLREIGVDYLQGWGISEPRPLDEITEELAGLET